jgi:hypothetical protein
MMRFLLVRQFEDQDEEGPDEDHPDIGQAAEVLQRRQRAEVERAGVSFSRAGNPGQRAGNFPAWH